jgi:two-component system, OmpR family, phosphate regulon sensor histidine kinase PhoR
MRVASIEALHKYLIAKKALILRGFFCWLIGCLALSTDEVNKYDFRFNLRGEQKVSSDIVLLTLYPSDFMQSYNLRTRAFSELSELSDISDSFFWDRAKWSHFLELILKAQPKSVGVALWFGENIIDKKNYSEKELKIFLDPKVIWSSSVNHVEKMLSPAFAQRNLSNVGHLDLRKDEDGIVRRIYTGDTEVPHLIEKMTSIKFASSETGYAINFRGNNPNFKRYTLTELMNNPNSLRDLRGKYILIGANTVSTPKHTTPVGALHRTEILAHMLDNSLAHRWVIRLPYQVYAGALLLLTMIAVFLITTYPQSVTFMFFIWIATLLTALSAWIFDSFSIWTPAFSPFILLAVTWIVFIGYQANRIEKLNVQLQQEQLNLRELEQLKNNFVSLISHDLKTPISKIQAITQRLRGQSTSEAMTQDLFLLHESSQELNKYIQSILNVLRVESRDFKLNREVADINELIEQALHQLRPLAQEKEIQIQTSLEPMFSSEFDATLIKEVIINLVENAIKYTPPGGLIQIASTEINYKIQVTISDTGQGIAAEDINQVWRKFVRGRDQETWTLSC